ncbi:hypothetical protein HDU67_002714, partial [Dinochytrium kinnereticum]
MQNADLLLPAHSAHVLAGIASPITVVYEEGKGRYAVASRDLKKGDLVLRARPFGI